MRTAVIVFVTALLAARADAADPERLAIVLLSRDARSLAPVLRERLERRHVAVELAVVAELDRERLLDAGAADATLVRVAVELLGPHSARARLVFAEPNAQRFAIREVSLPRGLDEIGRETIGTVVESAVDSLLAGRRLELTRSELSEALAQAPGAGSAPTDSPIGSAAIAVPPTAASAPRAPVVPPPPKRETPPAPARVAVSATAEPAARPAAFDFGVVAGYGTVVVAPAALTFMTGPLLAATARRGRAEAIADVAYLLPADLAATPLGAELSILAPRLGAAYAFPCARWCATAGARGGADVAWLVPTSSSTAASPSSARTIVSPTVGARASLDARLGSVAVGLLLTIDLDLLGARFVSGDGPDARPIATAWRARPGVAVTVGWR